MILEVPKSKMNFLAHMQKCCYDIAYDHEDLDLHKSNNISLNRITCKSLIQYNWVINPGYPMGKSNSGFSNSSHYFPFEPVSPLYSGLCWLSHHLPRVPTPETLIPIISSPVAFLMLPISPCLPFHLVPQMNTLISSCFHVHIKNSLQVHLVFFFF